MAVAAQFLISPFILDISLRWFYSMRWLKEDEIPEHLLKFIDRVCNQEKIKRPTIGLIEDGSPQAFTYGYSPSSARIVLSRGLMDLLTEKEVEAVVAHEIGHAVHWDILLMSMAQAVPLILYRFYRALSKIARESRKEVSAVTGASALLAYILYLISEYLVLWFSRTREYHADRFSGYATNDPGHLASALVKIGYGLAKHNPAHDEKIYEDRESGDAKSVGAMGIFDSGVSGSLAIVGYKKRMQGDDSDENDLKKVMRWDLWNPWARWYELNSTHPLIAHRLQYLSNQSITMNKSPLVSFDDKRPESYWDEFLLDFIIYALPICSLVSIPIIGEFALN